MNNELRKGSALFIALTVIILLLGIGVAYLTLALSKSTQTIQSTQAISAYEIAQAGLDMARAVLLAGHDNKWDDELNTSHDNEGTYNPDELPIEAGTDTALFQWARDISYHNARYWVILRDNDDGDENLLTDQDDKVNVRVRAFFPDGSESIVTALCRYKPPLYEPDNAIVSGGTLNISGGSIITGTQGSIYSNIDINMAGSSWVEQDAFARGIITGQDKISGNANEHQPEIDIPDINPEAYKSRADYELRANGDVYDVANQVVIGTATPTVSVLGWLYDGNTWTTQATVADGTYYVPDQKDVEVGASPGTEADPWQATLLVTGDVTVSSQAVMIPDEPGVVIMARQDVVLNGGIIVKDGIIATHEQMSITGNIDVEGMVLSEDAEDISPLVAVASELNITAGSATISYNGGITTFIDFGDPCVVILGMKREK